MEDTTSPIVALLCAVVPCLLFLAALGGGIFYFVKRRAKNSAAAGPINVTPAPVRPAPPPAPINTPAPAVPVQPVSTGADLFEQAGRTVDAPAVPKPVVPAEPVAVLPEQPSVPRTAEPPNPGGGSGWKNSPISPSELAALRGQGFAKSAGALNSWKILGTEDRVAGPDLARAVLAAAFLALEAAGDVRLEPGKKKAMLGLREADTLYVLPTAQAGGWPSGSYEDAILAAAAREVTKNRHHVQHLTYTILGEDAGVPWMQALTAAHDGLAQRGLLQLTTEKVLLAKVERRSLPPETAGLAARQDTAALQALLRECQETRPQVWQVLAREIKAGLDARQESSDD